MSFITSNEVREHIYSVFGKDIEIVEGKFPLRVQPIPEDTNGADPLDPTNCVFVHTVKRMYGSQMVIFWKKVAYADMVDVDGIRRVHRFFIPKEGTKRLSNFDRGEPFPLGSAITLDPPAKSQSLKMGRKRLKAKKIAVKKYVDRRKRFVSTVIKKRKVAEAATVQLKKAMANEKQDTKKIAQIKARKAAADAALKAVRDKIIEMDKSKAKRAPKKFDMTTRNGAAGNYNFSSRTVAEQPPASQ